VTSNTSLEPTARVIVLCFLVFLSLVASADTLSGKVVKITDGDTLYVLDANYQQHKIRLAGIDAPERKQAYGLASRKHLALIVAGKQVTVECQKPDAPVGTMASMSRRPPCFIMPK
jgi:endonuclease YncB( thermonuclease family)